MRRKIFTRSCGACGMTSRFPPELDAQIEEHLEKVTEHELRVKEIQKR